MRRRVWRGGSNRSLYHRLDALPRSANNKLNRRALAALMPPRPKPEEGKP